MGRRVNVRAGESSQRWVGESGKPNLCMGKEREKKGERKGARSERESESEKEKRSRESEKKERGGRIGDRWFEGS
eukprot:284106-Pleurochrysis_carterae.AAC.1